MNIDLLLSQTGEAGLIASENFVTKLAGIVMDLQTGLMHAEMKDTDDIDFNIPVDPAFFNVLEGNEYLHVGAVKNGTIGQAYQVALMFADDPYRGAAMGTSDFPLNAFERFVKQCVNGQAVHRDNLDDDSIQGCVLGDSAPSSLEFAPNLARRQALEVAPSGPSGPAAAPILNAPGLGLGSSGAGKPVLPKKPPPKGKGE